MIVDSSAVVAVLLREPGYEPILEQLALETREAAFLAVPSRDEIVYLDKVQADLQLQTAAIQPLKEMAARAESERDEARQAATELTRQVQTLERKLKEASSFLSGWKEELNDAA